MQMCYTSEKAAFMYNFLCVFLEQFVIDRFVLDLEEKTPEAVWISLFVSFFKEIN